MGSRNGFFQLNIKEDGTYIKLFEPELGGQPILFNDLTDYLLDMKLYEYDKVAIGKALAELKKETEVKLMDKKIYPVNELIKVEIREERMLAMGRFYPPSNHGTTLKKEDIISNLVRAGVKYGVDENNIQMFLNQRNYCTDIILAKATSPVQGTDAKITYHFNTDLSLKPKRNEDGSVDFHQLNTISTCKKNELLATLTPADNGRPGIDVCGNMIKPTKINNKVLRHGNKIRLSEDGLRMYSEVDGHVTLTEGRVFVSDIYEIPADVDVSTGDIFYDGNVIVKGNVITGFKVIAKGNIEVNGIVEGAVLEAGGQIILKRGMQGMNRGILKANGNIITKFIENSEVYAGGYISTESILHSKVSAKGDVLVGGKRGFVTGGEIRSGTLISVKTAGSHMGTVTLMEVGIDPGIMEEFRGLEKQLVNMQLDKEKLTKALALLRKKLDSGIDITSDKIEFLKQITKNNVILEAQMKEYRKRYEELRNEIDNNSSGTIKVQEVVYPGTKIVISGVIYYVREEVKHSRFVRDRADIRVHPY
ncbi:MAG: hypothetical protein K0S47_1957 [Herbinix sp.]|jgi:uncharacterized protein (DUF342 family)|nr:hypothetical protein [Herbinix sp.]